MIDNQTWEVPIDGVIDYTLGPINTTGNCGCGRGPVPYDRNLSTWELYFRPTYWLLPPGQTGRITIKLKEPTRLKLIRPLNTTNAGLNDFGTVNCRLELLADDNTPLWSRDLCFGRPWDRAFQAAFARPEFFGSYGQAFRGILEPGIIVPFGAGWLEVPVDLDSQVRSIRLTTTTFWATGGGLNEIQAYGTPLVEPVAVPRRVGLVLTHKSRSQMQQSQYFSSLLEAELPGVMAPLLASHGCGSSKALCFSEKTEVVLAQKCG